VVIFLEQAELRVKERRDLTLAYWRQNVDRMIAFNDRPLLQGAGSVRKDHADAIARERYELFDARRRQDEALAADAADLAELEALERDAKQAQGQST
jgi:hypothetical protein